MAALSGGDWSGLRPRPMFAEHAHLLVRSDREYWGRKDTSVRRSIVFSLAPAILLVACSHDPFGNGADLGTRTMRGLGAGAVVGAVAGTAVAGDPVTGAAAGMVVGGAIGALVKGPIIKNRQYYKDTRGYCYYVDPAGKPKRAPKIKC